MRKGDYKAGLEKYTQSLGQDPSEVTTYTNRYEMQQKQPNYAAKHQGSHGDLNV